MAASAPVGDGNRHPPFTGLERDPEGIGGVEVLVTQPTHQTETTHEPVAGVDRRRVIATGGALAAGAVAVPLSGLGHRAPASAAVRHFAHGVASGDPLPTAVVIWTRVTPTAAAQPGSGAGPSATVVWQVSTDSRFATVVRSGRFTTTATRDHTVKVDVTGLRPGTRYWYRFSYGGQSSLVGRTRTAPAAGAAVESLRFGVASCANLQGGWFSAYRHLAARDDLFAILFLGDYVYEYAPGQFGYGKSQRDIRPHVPARETVTLADYRQRHAQYKQDVDLQALHAKYPFVLTWDDHETANDTWTEGAENHQPEEGDFATRRRVSLQAYDEWQPVRLSGTAQLDDGTQIYRGFTYGSLIDLSLLDLRSYRNAPGEEFDTNVGVVNDPDRKIAGDVQRSWLERRLSASKARWRLVANPVMISPVLIPPLPAAVSQALTDVTKLTHLPSPLPGEGVPYNTDQWDGYPFERRRLLEHISSQNIPNVVFLTGDIHSGWACDVPRDKGLYPLGGSIATELVTTSVTSNNLDDIVGFAPRTGSVAVETAVQLLNRHIKYINFDDHGYSVLDVTPERVQMDWFIISDRADPRATSSRTRSFRVKDKLPYVEPTSTPIA